MNLTIFHENKDISLFMSDLASEARVINLENDEVLIGYFKPIKNIYVEMEKRLDEEDAFIEDELSLKIFNGSAYIDAPSIVDFTFGLTRSGLISWDNTIQKESTEKNKSMYWIKLNTNTPAEIRVNGINLSLSNDKDLLGHFPTLLSYLPENQKSFIGFHQEARNKIVQFIRNSGKIIRDHQTLKTKQVDQFDLLNIEEFKQASKYLTLKLIYSWLSRDDGDKWADKASEANIDYFESLNVRLMSVDENNNGKGEAGEMNKIQTILIINA